jgi:C4-dicarboxylate transporter DctQ subunit
MNNSRKDSVGRRIERFAGWLSTVERYFAGSVLILMTGLYALNIFVRTAFPTFASSFAWIDEAARYMMVWVVFIAAGIALEVGRHVSVNIAHDYMPPGLLSPLFKVIDVVGFVLSVGVAWFSFNLAMVVAGTGQVSPTLGVPTAILYFAPCVGFVSLAFRYFLQMVGLRDMRRDPKRPAWLGSGHI